MEPIIRYSGLELTFVEIILGVALLLLGAFFALLFGGRRKDPEAAALAAQMREKLSEMQSQQGELQGRIAQFAEDSAQRDDLFRQSLDERLSKVSERVGQSIVQTQERNSANLKQLHERLALIDRAQKNIETLSGEVSGLQSLLSNKQARGAFGEKQMQDLIESYLPPNAFSFQHTLSNGKRVDALIHLPGEQGDVAIDSKFPMEAWRRLTTAENTDQETTAKRAFAADVTRHIKDIASKYLIFGETHDIAMLFLPSEAVYAELHTHFPQVVEFGFKEKVMIVSPTTFMATLHTMRAVMRDAAMREQAHILQREVGLMAKDVTLLDDRVAKLQSHFNQSTEDLRKIRISTEKITKRADKIESLDVEERESAANNIAEFRKPTG
ncbi:DNA recombination protein RmuC [Litorimonas taeanensis]|uniref:DNA recombination protein RmuC homolog n=1 Tax=Litorimonas taeanensis TaxID=568099 RepID=A0A420WDN9_9PROT|nr:DNA recombination protein RmuC [Litorimonas taeanensis]RKQ69065.1 DNA recombination protein RmuC [Litorimonas taeanensis]